MMQLMHAANTYSVSQVKTMMGGVVIDGTLVQPEEVSSLEESARLRVVVAEGKKHEVRGQGS
jgi:16S rRNA U516 pseudouridylate synthase RsuA-like enzyme